VPAFLGRILCFFGLHDFQLIDATFAFGAGGEVTRVRCRRCGYTTMRRG
jgi:hypothetical protein